jgi:RNA polymerase sigma factor (sigma-70 family)
MSYGRVSSSILGPQPADDKPLLKALTKHKPLLARKVTWAEDVGLLQHHHHHEDAWQAAHLGFIQAYRRYDPSRGVSIGAFAGAHVTGAVREALAAYVVEGTAVPIEQVAEGDEDALQVEDAASRAEAMEIAVVIGGFIAGLTARQQYVVEQVFWHDRSQADVARELGITRQAVAMTLESVYARGRRVLARYHTA